MRLLDRLGWLLAGVLSVFAVAIGADLARGGPLDPAGAPSSTMKTLDDVLPSWHRVLSTSGPDPCNTERFDCVLADTAVLDRATGLVWLNPGLNEGLTWLEAHGVCYDQVITGQGGWRLPTISEITSLVGGGDPSPDLFLLTPNQVVWSATTAEHDAELAYTGWVGQGSLPRDKSLLANIFCVRGPGQEVSQLPQTPSVVPLCNWFSASRGDYFTTTDCDTAPAPDYGAKAMQGVLIDPLLPDVPGTVPVYLWFSATRGDYFTTTHPSWDPTTGSAAHDTYEFVATLGRLYTAAAAGRCALNGYFNGGPQDNLAQAENQAAPAGYGFSRTHGYMPGACP